MRKKSIAAMAVLSMALIASLSPAVAQASTSSITTVGSTSAAGTAHGLPVGANPSAVVVNGNFAYVANTGTSTVSVVDISDPAHPLVVGTTPAAGGYPTVLGGLWSGAPEPSGVALGSHYAYVSDYNSKDVSVVDISDRSNPRVVGTTPWSGSGSLASDAGPNSITVHGTFAYTANEDNSTVSVVDVSSPSHPEVVGTTPDAGITGGLPASAYPRFVVYSHDRLFVVDRGSSDISVINVTDPRHPRRSGITAVAGSPSGLPVSGNPVSIAVYNSTAYVANYFDHSVSVVNISRTDSPVVNVTSAEPLHPGSLPGLDALPSSVAVWENLAVATDAQHDTVDVLSTHTSYSVTLDANGGAGVHRALSGEYGNTLPGNTFTKAGYSFAGWNTHRDGTGASFPNRGDHAFLRDQTLYAQWSVNGSGSGLPNTGSAQARTLLAGMVLIGAGLALASVRLRRRS